MKERTVDSFGQKNTKEAQYLESGLCLMMEFLLVIEFGNGNARWSEALWYL